MINNYSYKKFIFFMKVNYDGFSNLELALIIAFVGILILFSTMATNWIIRKKLDFVIYEIDNITNNSNLLSMTSKFNQNTKWVIVKKEYNNKYEKYFEITRNKKTDLFTKKNILYVLDNINKNNIIYITKNGNIIDINTLHNEEDNSRIYGIAIKIN